MLRISCLALLAAMAITPASADDRWDRDGRYERDRRGRNNGSIFGRSDRYDIGVVERAMSNLRRAASRNQFDGHERNHFERALYHLDRFRDNYRRDRRFDTGRLNDAIEHLDDLARARQLHPRDREMIARDLYALRDFRSRGGSYGRW
jgi:hypothetical protein